MLLNSIDTLKIWFGSDSVGKGEDDEVIKKDFIDYEDLILSFDILRDEKQQFWGEGALSAIKRSYLFFD